MSEVKIVYRLNNSQRMAICDLIVQYMATLRNPNNVLPERFVDCSTGDDEGLEPVQLLNIFMDVSEVEQTS